MERCSCDAKDHVTNHSLGKIPTFNKEMKIMRGIKLCTSLLILFLIPVSHAEQVVLYAAGSLKSALGDVATAYEKATGAPVKTAFGPSGLMRQRIEKGEIVHVFASANMKHPHTLENQGRGGPVALFARNKLCAIAQANIKVSSSTLLQVLLDSDIRVGTSTPKADPSGDYAWELFGKADKLKSGNFEILSGKALKLTGGPNSPKAPEGRNKYGWVMEGKKADIFLTYCTNASLARREVPNLRILRVPSELSVGADYGLMVFDDAPVDAWRLALFILAPEGQRILGNYGFIVEALPDK
uniref:Molybdenum ABC transporter, molybdate-binding protein n=1 Tax=Candidatus Kentrum sp. MB TaxID=2138164 RepID=A0A450XR14_9GAMM|nr:MAG: molybdenum ABC transporter, molybdate-binding protein [Candidatus Kentron sp. MB]VFK31715.1 MAG: molybdenum ABC transporter, molybdate-binding protein [Candidatus Kentron sp. MB]VFK75626.1 MAG: molybdenum ABC transporter, molybdate-binding protein [Candidatus Kentron sp. MB]